MQYIYYKIGDGLVYVAVILIFIIAAWKVYNLAIEYPQFSFLAFFGISSLLGALLICKNMRRKS